MSLLTGSCASFRADHHERSEVGGAEAEGLANDTGTDPQGVYVKDVAAELGVHPRTVSRALKRGSSPPGERPAARKSKLDRYKRKCCNFKKGDGGSSERNWSVRSQAARSNSWSMN
jgi:hypothetical protein